jgi:hypothetical protein
MTGRRGTFAFIAAILLGVAAMFFLWPRGSPGGQGGATALSSSGRVGGAAAPRPAPPPLPEPKVAPATVTLGDAPSRLAEKLNAPDGHVRRDVEIVGEVLVAWQSNFPRQGNPVGENAEITAALTGDNPLKLALIPSGHPAINAAGELCDRWGTPFRFHQVNGTQMEIRSAGPDRKFATADDVQWPPGL